MPDRFDGTRAWLPAGALVLAAFVLPAHAEVRIVQADADKLVVEARDATVREILEALSAEGVVDVRGAKDLSRTLTGTYAGQPRRVLARILEGYDNVIEASAARLRISIVGAPGAPRAAGPVVRAVPAPKGSRVSGNVDADEEREAAAAKANVAPQRARQPAAAPALPAATRGSTKTRAMTGAAD
jgi:hypothetical protein